MPGRITADIDEQRLGRKHAGLGQDGQCGSRALRVKPRTLLIKDEVPAGMKPSRHRPSE